MMSLQLILRKVFFTFLYYTGIGHIVKKINQKNGRVPILLFHRVSDMPDPYWHTLPIWVFDNLIHFFSKHYKFRPIDDLFSKEQTALKGSCFIVFDDAFKDFYLNALPILQKYKVPVTMFAPAQCIEQGKPIWPSFLNINIEKCSKKEIRVKIKGIEKTFSLASKKGKIYAANKIESELKRLPYREFWKNYEAIITQLEVTDYHSDISVMNWDAIRQTSLEVDYQCHTMTHPILSNIDSEEDLLYELRESRDLLEKRIGKPVYYISYPIGSYSDDILSAVKEIYAGGFAVDYSLVSIEKLKKDEMYRYKIPRFNVSDADPHELFFRVNGFHKLLGR